MNSTKLAANLPETAWVLAIIFSTISGIGGCSSEEGRVNVSENFDGNSFDRTVWQMARPAPEDGTVEIKDDAMVFTLPQADKPRPQIRTTAKFAFTGNFEAMIDYSLLTPLPEPDKEYVNVELVVYGEEFDSHLSRVNHHGSGNGVVAYFSPKLESLKSHWTIAPTAVERGTLKVQRTGGSLEFLHRPESSDNFDVLGKVECGTKPIDGMCIAVTVATPTKTAFEVAIDNIAVRTIHDDVPLMKRTDVRIAAGAAVLLLIAGLGIWIARRPRKKPSGKSKPVANSAAATAANVAPPRRKERPSPEQVPDSTDDFNVS